MASTFKSSSTVYHLIWRLTFAGFSLCPSIILHHHQVSVKLLCDTETKLRLKIQFTVQDGLVMVMVMVATWTGFYPCQSLSSRKSQIHRWWGTSHNCASRTEKAQSYKGFDPDMSSYRFWRVNYCVVEGGNCAIGFSLLLEKQGWL